MLMVDLPETTDPVYSEWIEAYHNTQHEEVTRAAGEGDPDDWDDLELAMAVLLATAVEKQGAKVLKGFDTAISEDRFIHEFDDLMAEGNRLMSQTFEAAALDDPIEEILHTAMRRGSGVSGAQSVIDDLPRTETVLRGMVEAAKYNTNDYFNKFVMPALQAEVNSVLVSDTAVTGQAFRTVYTLLESRLKSVHYWRVVASAAASRGYSYGIVKAGRQNGYRGLRVRAILDKRTSEICRFMDGKTYWLADVERQVDQIASVEIEAVRDVAPWLPPEQIIGQTTNQLKDKGVMSPPYHGLCRTVLVLIK